MRFVPSTRDVVAAAENGFEKLFRGGVAELQPTPSEIIDEAPQRTLRHYDPPAEGYAQRTPVLLVPPLAAPARCFDLRPGCSMAEYLTGLGYPTYLVDYGRISFGDRELGLEHWVEDVIPTAAERTRADSGADRVQLVGWCLGGIMSLLAVADGSVPAASVAMVASPFDFSQVRLMAPIRQAAQVTDGRLVGTLNRVLGGAPSPIVKLGFQLSAIDKVVTKPIAVVTHLHDREFLAQIEAVDQFTANMIAYPGRTFAQLYHRFFRDNELSEGRLELSDRIIDVANVEVPVLSVAGTADTLAPRAAAHHIGSLVKRGSVRLETAPGGHLGVLTGRAAERTTWSYLDQFLVANDA